MLEGGHDYDGRPFKPLDTAGLKNAARKIKDSGLRSVAVCSSFSPLDPSCETTAREILAEICPDVAVTLSHDLGRIGLLERENAALLNASLHDLAVTTVAAFRKAISDSGLDAPLFLIQNDGTVMQADIATAFPVMSFASGATNSMRGAAHLSGLDDAMVVDVGGTRPISASCATAFRARPMPWSRSAACVRCSGCRTCSRSGSAAAVTSTRNRFASARSASATA
jgi:N-methylhydantoinase A/oxoprolinase/acetone carboxylase beta subunit